MPSDFVEHLNAPTVLVVDDEAAVRDFIRIALAHAGYAVYAAADAKHALEVFRANPKRFSLVLTDVRMPVRSGVELAADIRAIHPEVPVVFMSGFAGGTPSQPITLPTGADVLEKPFALESLIQIIKQSTA